MSIPDELSNSFTHVRNTSPDDKGEYVSYIRVPPRVHNDDYVLEATIGLSLPLPNSTWDLYYPVDKNDEQYCPSDTEDVTFKVHATVGHCPTPFRVFTPQGIAEGLPLVDLSNGGVS